jgi:hypothetical protein
MIASTLFGRIEDARLHDAAADRREFVVLINIDPAPNARSVEVVAGRVNLLVSTATLRFGRPGGDHGCPVQGECGQAS